MLPVPGEVFALRKLLPQNATYDFNVHVMDFLPGEFLNVKVRPPAARALYLVISSGWPILLGKCGMQHIGAMGRLAWRPVGAAPLQCWMTVVRPSRCRIATS